MKGTAYISILIAVVAAAAWLSACAPVAKIAEIPEYISRDYPTAENTYTSLLEISRAMEDAMAAGQTELTINVTGIDETDLRSIGDNMSTFWGKPTQYTISGELKDIDGIVPGRTVDVKTIKNTFELSDNYYIYDYIKNGKPIPAGRDHAQAIADALPAIAAEVFPDPGATDYAKALAAHDWLVANIDYDVSTPSTGDENGTYGAFILKRTMCQGYAEAFELLLRCYTDVETVQIVGEALDTSLNSPDVTDATNGTDATDGTDTAPSPADAAPAVKWIGHVWNAVKIDGAWYQVDTTFNDPLGTPFDRVSHFYFGQSDGVMVQNHRWNYEYFPSCYLGDFLYYRQSGLFAENWDDFQSIAEGQLTEAPVDYIEAAVRGATITGDNFQFMYKTRTDLDSIYWSEQVWSDIHVLSIDLVYTS